MNFFTNIVIVSVNILYLKRLDEKPPSVGSDPRILDKPGVQQENRFERQVVAINRLQGLQKTCSKGRKLRNFDVEKTRYVVWSQLECSSVSARWFPYRTKYRYNVTNCV